MKLKISVLLVMLALQSHSASSVPGYPPGDESGQLVLSAQRTQSIALLFSLIQCFPSNSSNQDAATQTVLRLNQYFNPRDHLAEYANLTEIQNLLTFVQQLPPKSITAPFLNDPVSIANLQIILVVLYRNAHNWPLFYATAAWLLQRVNTAMYHWCLMIVSATKFSDTVVVPSTAEVFPQLYLPQEFVLPAAGLPVIRQRSSGISTNPLYYWTTDPGLNEMHTHWHMDMPFWWNNDFYGVVRPRKGELFLYFHHQIVNRYNAELQSHGLPDVETLGLLPQDPIPFGYEPDIVNLDYAPYPPRPDRWPIGAFDDGPNITLGHERTSYNRMLEGIDLGFFRKTGGGRVSLRGEINGSDVLGATVEASDFYSADFDYYGSYHNLMHQYLSGMLRAIPEPSPGVEAHQETAMRDRVFFQIHKSVDNLYVKLKRQLTKPYAKEDLMFPGVSILDVRVTPTSNTVNRYGPQTQDTSVVLTTFMNTETFDISNAARPCRGVNEAPIHAQVVTLNHDPFNYMITVQSRRPSIAHGMVRIFLWPETLLNGNVLEGDEAHVRAIEMDRFRVKLNPNGPTIIQRSSQNSTFTRSEPSPGIKQLYRIQARSGLLTNPAMRRACGFPGNMLLPRGTTGGMRFKLTVHISDETGAGEVEENQYPHYPMCGVLNGGPFPDKRPMGFPFDRPETKLTLDDNRGNVQTMPNVKQMTVTIKHVGGRYTNGNM